MFDRGSWISLVPFVAVCFLAARIRALATKSAVKSWYPQLRRPEWTPPDWVFGPVWTTLYVMMATSAWLVWKETTWAAARLALLLFGIQLALSVLWSVMFFGLRRVGAAFGEVLLLWMMLIATAVSFYPLSLLAAWLLIPYIAWVGLASYLNFRIWQMN